MTEAEWMTATDRRAILELLQDKASDWKLRLFAVACRFRAWHLLTDTGKQSLSCARRALRCCRCGEPHRSGLVTTQRGEPLEFKQGQALMLPSVLTTCSKLSPPHHGSTSFQARRLAQISEPTRP
jgi:hypothetical protein